MTSTKLRLFCLLQVLGWLGFAILNYLALTLWYTTSDFWLNNIHTLLQSLLGLLLSLVLWKVFLRLWNKPIAHRMLLSFIAIVVVAFVWNILRMQLFFWIVLGGSSGSIAQTEWVFNKASIFFNFAAEGSSTSQKTYYWDDVSIGEAKARPTDTSNAENDVKLTQQINLPLDFENRRLENSVTDFGGVYTVLGPDPTGSKGTVAITTKPLNAKPWAGTTMGTESGFSTKIPVTKTNSTMTVWVYSPDANIPVRIKLENYDHPIRTSEAETITSLVNTWEALVFDFNKVPKDSIELKYAELKSDFGGWYFTALLTFLCWSALHHGIKYALLLQIELNQATGEAQRAKMLSLQASEMAKEAQLQMLRYQLNPHFMFNTLNAIYALIKLGDHEQAKQMVANLGKFLRYSLESDPTQLVSLSQELDALELYLDIERARFDRRLSVKIDVEPSASLCLVPSLILQPLIENAIKYAIAEQDDGGTIVIEAVVKKSRLVLTVSDDGPGVDLVDGKLPCSFGIGLNNTQQRLRTLYGKQHSLTFAHVKPHGLTIMMNLPYQKVSEK